MEKFIVMVNGNVWGGVVEGWEGVCKMFKDKGIEVLDFVYEGEYDVMDGVMGIVDMGDVDVYNEELCERGDDYCSIRVCRV